MSYDTILGMENAFLIGGAQMRCFSQNVSIINKALRRLKLKTHVFDFTIPDGMAQKNVLFIAMSVEDILEHKNELKCVGGDNLGIYIFDAWESRYEELEKLFNFIKPTLIFSIYGGKKVF